VVTTTRHRVIPWLLLAPVFRGNADSPGWEARGGGAPSHEQQDLLRAVLLFAGAGLDACANSSKRAEDGADVPPRTYRFALRTVLRGSLETAIPIEAAKPYDVSVAVVDGVGARVAVHAVPG
jgi:hypothetical protein